MRHTTLMLLKKDGKLLLGLKKRGFGLGKINGIGGKVEEGESVEAAAVRETFEEIGVNVSEMEHMADIVFDNLYYKGVPESHMMHIFIGTKWSGKPIETDEIKLKLNGSLSPMVVTPTEGDSFLFLLLPMRLTK